MKTTMQMVANLAGVSRGTVDRVVNKRGKVKPNVEKKILDAIEILHYEPNMKASALAYSRKIIKIGVICKTNDDPYFEKAVFSGVRDATEELQDYGIETIYRLYPQDHPEEILQIIDELVASGISGLSICAFSSPDLAERINRLDQEGISVVTYNSDVANCARKCFVGQSSYQSGQIAGDILTSTIRSNEKIIIVCGDPKYSAHQHRADGITFVLEQKKISEDKWLVIQTKEKYLNTYLSLKTELSENDSVGGIYMSAASKEACGDVLKELKLKRKPIVVCHDISPTTISYLKEGWIDFVIEQNLYEQGYKPLMILRDILRFNREPEEQIITTDLSIRSRHSF